MMITIRGRKRKSRVNARTILEKEKDGRIFFQVFFA